MTVIPPSNLKFQRISVRTANDLKKILAVIIILVATAFCHIALNYLQRSPCLFLYSEVVGNEFICIILFLFYRVRNATHFSLSRSKCQTFFINPTPYAPYI